MKMLTAKQKAILSFIQQYWEDHSISPSYREIQDFFSFKSPNAVSKHLAALVQKGFITLKRGKNFTKARSILPLLSRRRGEVPLVGRIVAGVPAESMESVEDRLSLHSLGIDNSMGNYFALRVNGDSMINAHIMDGDIVVVKKQPEVNENDVAAVLLEGEGTLKYVKKQQDAITLTPANDAMKPIRILARDLENFRVLGKVVTVIRNFTAREW